MSTSTIVALASILPIVGTIIGAAIRIGRAYGREEAMRSKYEQQVEELRKTQAKHGERLQRLERATENTGRHQMPRPGGGRER